MMDYTLELWASLNQHFPILLSAFYPSKGKAAKTTCFLPGPLHFTKSKKVTLPTIWTICVVKRHGQRMTNVCTLPTVCCSRPWTCRELAERASWPRYLRVPVRDPIGLNVFLHLPPYTFNFYVKHWHSEISGVNFVTLTRLSSSFLFYFYGIYMSM